MFGIGDDYNVEKTAKKIFGAKKFFHTPYSKNTNTLFKRKMSKTFTTLDSHTAGTAAGATTSSFSGSAAGACGENRAEMT